VPCRRLRAGLYLIFMGHHHIIGRTPVSDFTPHAGRASGSSTAVRRSVAPRLAAAVAVVLLVTGCKGMATRNGGATSDGQRGYGQQGDGMDRGSDSGGGY
jgi:hypothetical protein